MNQKQKRIIVGTAVACVIGMILIGGSTWAYITLNKWALFVGLPLVVGCGWAFLSGDGEAGK